jgi:hypothetical protein
VIVPENAGPEPIVTLTVPTNVPSGELPVKEVGLSPIATIACGGVTAGVAVIVMFCVVFAKPAKPGPLGLTITLLPDRENLPPSSKFGDEKAKVPLHGLPSLQVGTTVETKVLPGAVSKILGEGGLKLSDNVGVDEVAVIVKLFVSGAIDPDGVAVMLIL